MDAWKGSQMSSCGQWCQTGASRMRASGRPGWGLPFVSHGIELWADTVKAKNTCIHSAADVRFVEQGKSGPKRMLPSEDGRPSQHAKHLPLHSIGMPAHLTAPEGKVFLAPNEG